MNEQLSDKEFHRFFQPAKNDISDQGFSDKVMRQLPAAKDRSYIIYTFLIAGLLTFIFTPAYGISVQLFYGFMNSLGEFQVPSTESIIACAAGILIIATVINVAYQESVA